jgi:carbon-monoxide dehydrogenase medium subunit
MALWDVYYTVTHLDDALQHLSEHGGDARIVAGATDLIVEINNKLRAPSVLIDITRVGGLNKIRLASDSEAGGDGLIHIGPTVTHAQAAASPLLQKRALPLAQTCWGVGGPQLRNRGTISGNVVTATPANDTITTLRALGAQITLRSTRGERVVPVEEFCTHVRCTVLEPDEMVTDIAFPPLTAHQRGVYLKLRPRKALAIAVVNVAIILTFNEDPSGPDAKASGPVTQARIALGCVAPTIIGASEAEAALVGGPLTDARIAEAAALAAKAALPIDDVRGSAWFRREEVEVLVRRGLEVLRPLTSPDPEASAGEDAARLDLPPPDAMVRLWGKTRSRARITGHTIAHHAAGDEPIECTVNGENVSVHGANGKTLLHMLRDHLGLMGTKVGCEEGECGACTVWLDGIAVLACLTPAPRAHGANIVTVEGLGAWSGDDRQEPSIRYGQTNSPSHVSLSALHPVQRAFVEEDAIQCGYCTPGFVMSAAKLLEEHPHPTRAQIITALSGNLCRCTGYYKIIRAVERAAEAAAASTPK